MIKISPSLLAADFSKLGEEIGKVEGAGADMIHIDIMDGHFVPNITIGSPVVKSLKNITSLPFDVHLMIENSDLYIDDFIDAGADIITVHAEESRHLNRSIQMIRQRGKKAAVALNPATSLSVLDWIIHDIDMVLIMTVNPGFGGQEFIKSMLEKIRVLRERIESFQLKVDIQVDGGINLSNIHEVTKAGANVIVAGSAVYKAPDTVEIVKALREKACI